MHIVASKLHDIENELRLAYMERAVMIESILLTLTSGSNGFVVGSPGTGKSELIRNFCARFHGADYFESLLSRTRPEAAILGPYDLPALRQDGDFHRKVTGFLPTAHLAFLDEIGKMSPTLGHDLLAILNEHVLHEVNGGRSARTVPLSSAFTASNELIADESDDAAALWDRLLIRCEVRPIQDNANFARLLQSTVLVPNTTTTVTTIDWPDVKQVIDEVIPAIALPKAVIGQVIALKTQLREHEIYPSDRRWRQSMRVLQAAAFLRGSNTVEEDDLHALRFTLWESPTHISTVERITLSISNPTAEKMLAILDKAEEIAQGINKRRGQSLEARAQYGAEVIKKTKLLVSELGKLRQESLTAGRSVTKLDEATDRLDQVRRQIYIECLDMDPAVVK